MKKLNYLIAIVIVFYSCNPDETTVVPQDPTGPVLVQKSILTDEPQGEPFTQKEIDKIMFDKVQSTGDFSWENSELKVLTSAAKITQLVAIGYQPARIKNVRNELYHTNIKSAQWKSVHDAIIELVVSEINRIEKTNIKAEEIISEDDNTLPIIIFKISDKSILTKLFNLENVRYIEPI